MVDLQNKPEFIGRTTRHITVAIVAVLLPLLILIASASCLFYLWPLRSTELNPMAFLFAALTLLTALCSIVYSVISLIVANDNIFFCSGVPIPMSRSIYESSFLQSQTLLSILVVGIICVLMASKLIQPSEGLPVVTFATGFALGRQFQKPPSDK
ncbi:MAG: hypothetical protein ABSG91_05805 [Syntrophobacteraceae bacterium]